MNTYTKFFLALCCSGTIVSCSNDLDEKVYSKITEQTYNYTVDDFSPSIASVYSQLRSFPSHGGYFTTQEVSADAIVMPLTLPAGMMAESIDVCTTKHGTPNKDTSQKYGPTSIKAPYYATK